MENNVKTSAGALTLVSSGFPHVWRRRQQMAYVDEASGGSLIGGLGGRAQVVTRAL